MSILIELFLKLFFVQVVYPLALQIAMKRETDPAFKAKSDEAYQELNQAKTPTDRKSAARKIYELQKGS